MCPSSEESVTSGRSRPLSSQSLLVWLLLLVLLGAVYWPTLSYGPVVDDPPQIEWVRSFDGISEVFGTDAGGFFRPVKNIAFYLFARDGDLFDLRVASLLIFASFGTACYLFALRFLKFEWALLTALLVVLHPAQVASVAFPSAINNIFSGVFILLFCGVAIDFLKGACGFHMAVPLLLVFAALALLGYELAVVIVPLSVLFAFYFRESAPFQRSVSLIVISLIMVAAYLVIRSNENAISEQIHMMIPPSASRFELFCSAPYYTLKHLWMAVCPLGQGGILIADDPRGGLSGELPFWVLLGILLLAAVWWVERKRSLVALGLLFFVFAMAPLSNWLPLRNGPIANYYLLLPLCGLALAVGALFEMWSSRRRSWLCLLAWAGLLVLLALGASYRASWWHSQYSIYELTVRNHPDNWVAWSNWGVALGVRGENDFALEAFERSSDLADWYVPPYQNRIWLLLLLGRDAEAVVMVEQRGGRFSPSLAAAATIAYAREGNRVQAADWARKTEPERLSPGHEKWFKRVASQLGDE